MIVWFLSILITGCVADPEPRYPPSSYPAIQSPYTYKLHLSDCHYVNETECVTQEELRCSVEDKEVCVEVSETECKDEEEEVCTTVETQDCQEVEKMACATFPTQECKVMQLKLYKLDTTNILIQEEPQMVMETVCEETMKEECFSFDVEKCEVTEETICNEVNETVCVPTINNVTGIDVKR